MALMPLNVAFAQDNTDLDVESEQIELPDVEAFEDEGLELGDTVEVVDEDAEEVIEAIEEEAVIVEDFGDALDAIEQPDAVVLEDGLSEDMDAPLLDDDIDLSLPDPLYTIESVKISGNIMLSDERVMSMLQIREGDRVQLKDLEDAKLRLVTGGTIEYADVSLRRGSSKGKVKIVVRVYERLNFHINDYYVGISDKSKFWLGLNVSYLNLLGSDHRLDVAFVASPEDEFGFRLNYYIPYSSSRKVAYMMSIFSSETSEEVFLRANQFDQKAPDVMKDSAPPQDSVGIRRHGASFSVGFRLIDNLGLHVMTQANFLNRNDDKLQDVQKSAMDKYLEPGSSFSWTLGAMLIYDTRDNFRMPTHGHLVGLNLSGQFIPKSSDYDLFLRGFLFHQSNFQVAREHILRVYSRAGFVVGDAPYYEKFRFNDFYSFTPNKILGFVPSSAQNLDLFKTGSTDLGYEDFLVNVLFEYAWQRELYMAYIRSFELYVNASVAYADSLEVPEFALGNQPNSRKRSAFPCDGSIDLGVKFDTEFGFFKVSLGYVLNLVPR